MINYSLTASTPSSLRVPEAVDESLNVDFIVPEVYEKYGDMGLENEFRCAESGPLVRPCYHADKHVHMKL